MKHDNDVVSASEIASWAWCPESWRLESLEVGRDDAGFSAGRAFHDETAVFEERSRSAISLGWWLLVSRGPGGSRGPLSLMGGSDARLFAVALVLGLLGLLLVVLSKRGRAWRGFGPGETVALDNVTLFSERLKLVGRPDRIVKEGGHLIPEEWKSAKRVSHGHRLQLGAYFLLIEEEYGKRPPFGVVVGDG